MAKVARTNSAFTLVGKIKLDTTSEDAKKQSFKIEQINEKGNWMSSTMNFGVDCGQECGTVYASLTGGHSLSFDSKRYIFKRDQNGNLITGADGKYEQYEISFSERESFDMSQLQSYDGFTLGLGVQGDNKTSTVKKYVFEEDFIKAVKDNIKDGDKVRVLGHLTYYRNPEDGTVTITKQIQSVYLSRVEDEKFSATFNMSVLIDEHTVGQPNAKDRVIPLFVKVCDYVGTVNKKKYNDNGCYAIKILYDYSHIKPEDKLALKTLKTNLDVYFKAKPNEVNLLVIKGKFVEGTPVTEIRIEDYPQETQNLFSLGLISKEELEGIAATGNRTRDMYFTSFGIDKETVKIINEKGKYKTSEIIMAQDLPVIEDKSVPTPTSNNVEIPDLASDLDNNDDFEPDFINSLFGREDN